MNGPPRKNDRAAAAPFEPESAAKVDLSRMRHELRTPINHILGYCEMLMEEGQFPEAHAEDLRRIHADIKGYNFVSSKGPVQVTVSVGISGYPHQDVWTKDDLIRMADAAMYEAKNQGRDRISSWDAELLDDADEPSADQEP